MRTGSRPTRVTIFMPHGRNTRKVLICNDKVHKPRRMGSNGAEDLRGSLVSRGKECVATLPHCVLARALLRLDCDARAEGRWPVKVREVNIDQTRHDAVADPMVGGKEILGERYLLIGAV